MTEMQKLQYEAELAHHKALEGQGNAQAALARLSVAVLNEKRARGMKPTDALDPFDMPPAPTPAPTPAPAVAELKRGDWFDSEPYTAND